MSFCTIIIDVAKIAVRSPIKRTICKVVELSENNGAKRASKKPPALINPACKSACIGVGAKRESGSHI